MSKRELGRVEVLARVRSKQLRVVDAARLMRVSCRQGKRLWKRYGEEGAAGLKHRSAGRPSNRAYEEKFRQKVLRLVREKYGGPVGERFAPTLAAEHLASEDGLQVDAETLRRWMLAQLRPGRVGSVIDQVDQATLRTALLQPVVKTAVHLHHLPKVLLALAPSPVPPLPLATPQPFRQQETIWAVADALRAWIERYGVPLALYVDGKNCTSARPRRKSGCAEKSRSRSLGACARSWGSP